MFFAKRLTPQPAAPKASLPTAEEVVGNAQALAQRILSQHVGVLTQADFDATCAAAAAQIEIDVTALTSRWHDLEAYGNWAQNHLAAHEPSQRLRRFVAQIVGEPPTPGDPNHGYQ